jgi:DNA-binding transcriptional LysR family regulator
MGKGGADSRRRGAAAVSAVGAGSAFLMSRYSRAVAYDWNDLRVFLAVARAGSTLAASRALGSSQSTVARRIEALEHALGAALFERQASGYRLTPAGRDAVAAAEDVERKAEAFAARFPTAARRCSGPLRVTTNDMLAQAFVAPALTAARRADPDLAIELIVGDARLDLLRGEADLALRAGSRPEEPGLVRQKMPILGWGLYCSRAYRDERGAPSGPGDLASHALVLAADPAARIPALVWLEAAAEGATQVTRVNTLAALLSAIKAGMGVSILPRAVADVDADLVLGFPAPAAFEDNVWLTYPASSRGDPRVRRLADAILARFREVRRASA